MTMCWPREKIESVLPLIFFSVVLPTCDVWSDLAMSVTMFRTVETLGPGYFLALLLPFLLNYLYNWYAWLFRSEDEHDGRMNRNKTKTFLYPLLGIYPQYRACLVVQALWQNVIEGEKKKKIFERKFVMQEIVFEALPSFSGTMYIWGKTLPVDHTFCNDFFGGCQSNELAMEEIKEAIGGGILFVASFVSSFLTCCFGLAKCLKVNSVPAVEGGPADSFLSGRFLVAFICSGLWIFSKVLTTAVFDSMIVVPIIYFPHLLLGLLLTVDVGAPLQVNIHILYIFNIHIYIYIICVTGACQ